MKVTRRSEHRTVLFANILPTDAFESNGILYVKIDSELAIRIGDHGSKPTKFDQTYKVKKISEVTYTLEHVGS